MNGRAPPASNNATRARRRRTAAARRVVHLLLGHTLVDEARGPTAGAAGGAIRRTICSPIRCAGSRSPSRAGALL